MPHVYERPNTSRAVAHNPRSSGISFPAVMPAQLALIVKDGDTYAEFGAASEIITHIQEEVPDRKDIATLLAFWGSNGDKHFSGWETAISEAAQYLRYLKPRVELWTEGNLDPLKLKDTPLKVQPGVLNAANLEIGEKAAIDVDSEREKVKVPIVDITGKPTGEHREIVHPVFADIAPGEGAFIIVALGDNTDNRTFEKVIPYEGRNYRINRMAGSSLKPKEDNPGSVFGIREDMLGTFKHMFGFEESVYYAQRALFPEVKAGVTGNLRGRAIPIEKGMEHVFKLKGEETLIKVEDGWGYIRKSFTSLMEKDTLTKKKREYDENAGHLSYQMLQWLDKGDSENVTRELIESGIRQWHTAVANYKKAHTIVDLKDLDRTKKELQKVMQSILTTGNPDAEMSVAMPVPGNNIVIPAGHKRYDKQGGEDISVIRSPADKQNFYPVSSENVENNTSIANLVGNIEGIQYTLTGKEDGTLTFFKGMVGIIDDSKWPDEWAELDIVVSSKDRKLFEKWRRDSSLEKNPAKVIDPQTDRATMSKMQQDFSINGTFAAVQWFKAGSFVGVPSEIQKWLGGDYDGDEVAMVFSNTSPHLQQYIVDNFSEEQQNPKLTKTFTYSPEGSYAKRMDEMRSNNAGVWSSIATRVQSLKGILKKRLAQSTKVRRLLPVADMKGTEVARMMKEIQLGIKVGTDGPKTSANVKNFEKRAETYLDCLNAISKPVLHNKTLLKTIGQVGADISMKDPAWQRIFFTYNEVSKSDGEHVVNGLSPRIMNGIIGSVLSQDDLNNLNVYYNLWKQADGFDLSNENVPEAYYRVSYGIAKRIDQHLNDRAGTASRIMKGIVLSKTKGTDNLCDVFSRKRKKLIGKNVTRKQRQGLWVLLAQWNGVV